MDLSTVRQWVICYVNDYLPLTSLSSQKRNRPLIRSSLAIKQVKNEVRGQYFPDYTLIVIRNGGSFVDADSYEDGKKSDQNWWLKVGIMWRNHVFLMDNVYPTMLVCSQYLPYFPWKYMEDITLKDYTPIYIYIYIYVFEEDEVGMILFENI